MMDKLIKIIRTIGIEIIGALIAFYTMEGVVDDFLRRLPDDAETLLGIIMFWVVYKVIITAISNLQK